MKDRFNNYWSSVDHQDIVQANYFETTNECVFAVNITHPHENNEYRWYSMSDNIKETDKVKAMQALINELSEQVFTAQKS